MSTVQAADPIAEAERALQAAREALAVAQAVAGAPATAAPEIEPSRAERRRREHAKRRKQGGHRMLRLPLDAAPFRVRPGQVVRGCTCGEWTTITTQAKAPAAFADHVKAAS